MRPSWLRFVGGENATIEPDLVLVGLSHVAFPTD